MKPLLIFGTGSFAELAKMYFTQDANREVVAFVEDADTLRKTTFEALPVIPFSDIEDNFAPEKYDMFIAIGYRKLNSLRQHYMQASEKKGYILSSYIYSGIKIFPKINIGKNVFIFEDNTIQPCVSIGDGTVLWSGNHIGHHSKIGNYCFLASHVVVSGHCKINDYCFLGVNSAVCDTVEIGTKNIIGAGAIVHKNTKDNEVWVGARAVKLEKTSDKLLQ